MCCMQYGSSALSIAAEKGFVDLVTVFLEHHAQIDLQNDVSVSTVSTPLLSLLEYSACSSLVSKLCNLNVCPSAALPR